MQNALAALGMQQFLPLHDNHVVYFNIYIEMFKYMSYLYSATMGRLIYNGDNKKNEIES